MAARFRFAPVLVLLCLMQSCGNEPSPLPRWYFTCGDPVCRGYVPPGLPACTSTQVAGQACSPLDARCDPHDDCNRLVVCSVDDPTQRPGGCPISRASAKRDVRYLDDVDLDRRYAELRALRLATYRYREAGPTSPERLGFMIDDGPPTVCVAGRGDSVDLYGYTSLAVAAVQAQARRLEELEREVATVRARLERQTKTRASAAAARRR